MQEYVTSALVLESEGVYEQDLRIKLFTQQLGRVDCFVKAGQKSTAKLTPHVQPLCITKVRLVEKKGFQLTDALVEERLVTRETSLRQAEELLSVARLLIEQTALQQPDEQIWELITKRKLLSRDLLRILGFDPAEAHCERCRRRQPTHFLLREAMYLCTECLQAVRAKRAVMIY